MIIPRGLVISTAGCSKSFIISDVRLDSVELCETIECGNSMHQIMGASSCFQLLSIFQPSATTKILMTSRNTELTVVPSPCILIMIYNKKT